MILLAGASVNLMSLEVLHLNVDQVIGGSRDLGSLECAIRSPYVPASFVQVVLARGAFLVFKNFSLPILFLLFHIFLG